MKFQCIKNVYRIKILFKAIYIIIVMGGPAVSHSPGAQWGLNAALVWTYDFRKGLTLLKNWMACVFLSFILFNSWRSALQKHPSCLKQSVRAWGFGAAEDYCCWKVTSSSTRGSYSINRRNTDEEDAMIYQWPYLCFFTVFFEIRSNAHYNPVHIWRLCCVE